MWQCFSGTLKERSVRENFRHCDAKHYRGKTWLTRPRPEIDRVGSAWLIPKFIDPKAKFIFAQSAQSDCRRHSVRHA